MMFDYFYEAQSESYAFYRTPKVLFTDERFKELSSDAKLLYGILLDRIQLSKKNRWIDDNGRVYVYMTITGIEKALCRGHQKSIRIMEELEEIGLIERKRQGQGRPTRIYVKNFGVVCNSYFKEYENHTSRSSEIIPLEVCNSYPNNTDINNTEINNINPILSVDKDKDARDAYREYFVEKLDMAMLRETYPYDENTLEAIINLILDVVCSKRKVIRIAGDDKPVDVVKSQFLKLNHLHIEYALRCLSNNSSKVRNIKQYLMATLYNAPMTMDCYYQAMVNHDMAGGD